MRVNHSTCGSIFQHVPSHDPVSSSQVHGSLSTFDPPAAGSIAGKNFCRTNDTAAADSHTAAADVVVTIRLMTMTMMQQHLNE